MRCRPALVVAAILLAATAARAEISLEGQALQRWEFAKDAEGWLPAHSLAPFEVKGGILHLRATGPDPYALCSDKKAFEITASDRQYIVIRAKVSRTGSAEFFWASSLSGEDVGFAGGKEVGFQMIADGAFHTYLIFPMWKGRVTRIRFDPADLPKIEVWVDYIAIGEVAETPPPEHPVFTFDRGLEGWVPRADVSDFFVKDGALQVAGLPERSPALVSPGFTQPAEGARFIQLRLATRNLRSALVRYTTKDDPEFDYMRTAEVAVTADGKPHSYLVPTAGLVGWSGEIARLELDLIAVHGAASAAVDTIAVVPGPIGPPAIIVAEFGLPGAVLYAGETQQARIVVQNGGGAPLEGVKVTLSGEPVGGEIALGSDGALGPGETREVAFNFTPKASGRQQITARGSAGNAEPVEKTAQVTVSNPVAGAGWIRHKGAYVDRVAGSLWLVNEKIAAVFAKNAFGYGPASLRVLDPAGWRQVGALPDLGEIVTAQGAQAIYPAGAQVLVGDGEKAAVEFRGKIAAAGASGEVRLTFVLRKGSSLVEVALAFTPDRKGELLALRLPKVLAGDGAFGTDLKHGVFGGLEYLARGEHSSSTIDIAPPENLRFAPHPNRVTLPAMAVTSPGGDLVGLIWDQMQRWDGIHTRPTAVFASPNFLDGQPNHLMALFVPSIPEWVEENSLAASRPYALEPGKPLRLTAAIALARESDVLQIARLWYDRFGTPDLPPVPRTLRDDVAFSLRSYEQVLFAPGQGWRGLLQWAPQRNPRVALHYVLAEMLLGSGAPVANARALATERMGGRTDVDLAVHLGHLLDALQQARSGAYGVMGSQDAKGGWYFQPDQQHRPLGQPGDTTVGTVAGHVAQLLRAGRILSDPHLIGAGERGLAFMDRFDVPRGAQVWEVPLHTPDILASGHAVTAYLEGYLATGNKHYLERAVFWAKTGIPFIYTWQAPEKDLEAMNYGSIPVLGATYYTGSWFGRLVQWCGLAYAHAIQRLAPYDQSFDWKRLAEGITISGMIQQRTEAKYLGCYPDSIGMLDGTVSWGAMLSPQLVLDNVFALLGQPVEAAVETAALAGRPVAVVSARGLSDLSAEGNDVAFRVAYPEGLSSEAAVIGVTEPRAVRVNGEALPRLKDLEAAPTGWTYDETLGAAVMKISHGAQPAAILVQGVEPSPERAAVTRWDFRSSLGGWAAASDLAPLERAEGVLRARITGPDPFMVVDGLEVKASDYRGVRIRMKSPVDGNAEVFFAAGGRPIGTGASKAFAVVGDGQSHDYEVELSSVPGWTGLVTALRIDPVGKVGDVAEIASVEFME